MHSSTLDPAEAEAVQCLERGTQKLEEGDVHAAKELYKRSVEIKRNASSLFNLGVTHYHLSESYIQTYITHPLTQLSSEEFDDAILAWKESIEMQPASPDAHTSTFMESFLECFMLKSRPRPSQRIHSITCSSTGQSFASLKV